MRESDFNDDINMELQDLVQRGLVEQYIDENGDFVFEITAIGRKVADDIFKSREGE